MARTKKLNFVVEYGDTGYYINDNGPDKPKRFELYDNNENKVILKTDNPYDCNEWVKKHLWKDIIKEINTDV